MDIPHLYRLAKRHLTLNNGVLAVALLLITMGVWSTIGTLQKNFVLQQKVDSLDRDIELAALERDTLKLQQQYFRSGEYIELVARRSLGLARSGEKLVVLPKAPPEPIAKPLVTATVSPSNLDLWYQFFFGR